MFVCTHTKLSDSVLSLNFLLFITLVMICESKTRKIKYFEERRYVHEGITGL